MKLKAYINRTIFDATKDMISAIDYSDYSIEHIVVVPDRFSLQMEKLLLRTLKNTSLFNVKVMGLTSLATEIFNRLNIKIEVLSSAECLLLTKKAIENVKKDFSTFRKTSINFCYEVNKVLSQIKSCKLTAEDLNESASGLTGAKYHDIKLIFDEYQRLLEGKYDANERLNLLNETIKSSNILSNTKFYFAHFDSFTNEGYDLIKTLVESAMEVNVSMACPQSIGNEYIYERDILDKLTKIAKQCQIEIEVLSKESKFSPQKNAIVNGVYSYQIEEEINNGFYSLFSSQTIREEVRDCSKLVYYFTTQGFLYSDIVVAVSDLNKYQPYIEELFDKFELPYYIDSSITADNTILVNLIFNFFEVIVHGYSSDKLINLFNNFLLGDNQNLIEIVQKYNIDNRWKYKKYIASLFQYNDILENIEECKDATDFQMIIEKILISVQSQFEILQTKLQEKSFIKEHDINRQIYDIIKETISLITKYNSKISINDYLKTLKLLLSFKEVSTVPSYVDGIMVGDASASYFGECKILILLGSQSLPAISADNGLLNDDDLQLNYINKKIEPSIRMINRRNRFRLFNLLTLSSDRLILFYQPLNEEGKKNELPAFIDSLNKIFSQIELKTEDVFSVNFARESNILVKLGNRKNFIEENYRFLTKEMLANLNISHLLPFENFIIKKDEIKEGGKLFLNGRISVSQLESYFSCPFKHFLNYGLKLQEKQDYKFDARDVGNICHKGGEILVKQIIENKVEKNINIYKFIDENFDYITKETNTKEKFENASERESITRFFKHQLKVFLSDILNEMEHSTFKPKYVEFKLPNSKIGEKHKVDFSGKVDRIDTFGNYFRIIDYKTGNTGNILKELYYGEKLQLFLYQNVVKNMLNKKPAGVFYFNAKYDYTKNDEDKVLMKGIAQNDKEILDSLDRKLNIDGESEILPLYKDKDGCYKGSVVAKEDISVYEDYALKLANNAIEEIGEGYIQPKPNEDSCKFCRFNGICGFENINGKRKQTKVENFKEILKNGQGEQKE